MESVDIRVRGMVCRQCEDSLALGLARLRGVQSVTASYSSASVSVGYDAGRCDVDKIERRLSELGYPAGEGLTGAAIDVLSVVLAVSIFALLVAFPLPMAPRAEAGQSLAQLFVLGALTSVHCVAMCGGIMLANTAAPTTGGKSRSRGCDCDSSRGITGPGVRAALAYNGGRMLGYALVGGLFGGLGSFLAYAAGVRVAVFFVAGALVVVMGLRMMGLSVPLPSLPKARVPRLSRLNRVPAALRPLGIGMLTAVMPCGALASMWMVAAASGSAVAGGAAMLAFAAGTVPLMLGFSVAGHLMPASWSRYLLRASAVLVVALGLSLAWKGVSMAMAVAAIAC